MIELVTKPAELPSGSHSLSFYANRPEAAQDIANFLRGASDRGQTAMVLTADDEMMSLYQDAVEREVPQMLKALRRIDGPHVRSTEEGLRPIPEVLEFASSHPEGMTMCGDTIPDLLNRRTLPNVLAYEDWFDSLRPFYHRGLCPYDLNNFPVDRVADAFTGLAAAHTHGVLSTSPDPSAQFLQLLILPVVENPLESHLGWLARAVDRGLIDEDQPDGHAAELTPRGETFARALRALPNLTKRVPRTGRDRESGIPRGREDPRSPRLTPEE